MELGEIMNAAVKDSIGGTDAVLFVVEPKGELDPKELELIQKFKQEKIPTVLVINKIDTLSDKTVLLSRLRELSGYCDFTAAVPVSAQTGEGIADLMDEMKKLAVPSVHYFQRALFSGRYADGSAGKSDRGRDHSGKNPAPYG